MEELSSSIINNKKRVRSDSIELEVDSPEVKRLRDDLLSGFLDDSDPEAETKDLDSVMKSFQEEICVLSDPPVEVVDLTSSDSGESYPNLGYLLEASDDELGLPPSSSSVSCEEVKNGEVNELVRVASESSGIDLWGFEDHIPSYESYEVGVGIGGVNNIGEYVEFDGGLFDYSNVYFDSSEYSDFSWRHETSPTE